LDYAVFLERAGFWQLNVRDQVPRKEIGCEDRTVRGYWSRRLS